MARKAQSPPKSFEDALLELDGILTDIESGKAGLEESLVKYERGNFLIQHCRGVLNAAERQIETLSKGPDGSAVTAPIRAVTEGGAGAPAGDASEPEDDDAAAGE